MKKLTKKELEVVAKNFNEVLELDPPIVTGRMAKMPELEKDVNDVVVNHLTKEDKISKEVAELIKQMQLEPEEVVEEEMGFDVVDEVVEETPEEEVVEEVVEEEMEKEIEEVEVKKSTKKTTDKGPGVIASIFEFIQKGNISKEQILDKLVSRFPDRAKVAMGKTINAQVGGKKHPCRMEKEKNVTFEISNKGMYSVK